MIAFEKKVYFGSGRPREVLIRKNIFCEITPKKRKYHSNHVYSKFLYFELWIKVLSALYLPLAGKTEKSRPRKTLKLCLRELKSPKKIQKIFDLGLCPVLTSCVQIIFFISKTQNHVKPLKKCCKLVFYGF